MEIPMPPVLTCSSCHTPIQDNEFFCAHCGKKIKEPPLSVSVLRQIWIYALSFFLPPLGLAPGIKYLKNPDPKAKTIGSIAIFLTIFSIALGVYLTYQFFQTYTKILNGQLDSTSSELQQLQNLQQLGL